MEADRARKIGAETFNLATKSGNDEELKRSIQRNTEASEALHKKAVEVAKEFLGDYMDRSIKNPIPGDRYAKTVGERMVRELMSYSIQGYGRKRN